MQKMAKNAAEVVITAWNYRKISIAKVNILRSIGIALIHSFG